MTRSRKLPKGGRRRGVPLLLFFLLATLVLTLWLGFQAVGAARSHRRTAEGILRDYAEIAVAEYSRRVQERLDLFFREVFDEVPWRIRRDRPPSPQVVRREMNGALRRLECECPGLRERAVYLMADLSTGGVEAVPEALAPSLRQAAVAFARAEWESDPGTRIALRLAPAGVVRDEPAAIAFNASLDASGEEGRGRAIYLILMDLPALGELFQTIYEDHTLLPRVVAGSEPNDSLLHLGVFTSGGKPIFLSPRDDPQALAARDTLPLRYGRLIVESAIRPDAAGRLVIGGLPRGRLPLLLALMLLALGVGLAALVQIRREDELSRLRDDFISSVSHEFRTPLTQIRMFAELLADGKLRTEEERQRSVAVLDRESRRLTHLVENILHFSRTGRRPAAPGSLERVPLAEACREAQEAFGPMAESGGSTISVVVDPPTLAVRAQRDALHQMLANLLDNALKYGPDGQVVRLEATAEGDRVRIAVEDEGPGIPPRERERVWHPYRRLERDVAGDVQGSGIGLAVVADLARSAGGSVRVEERPGGGGRFVIELPGGGVEDEEGERRGGEGD